MRLYTQELSWGQPKTSNVSFVRVRFLRYTYGMSSILVCETSCLQRQITKWASQIVRPQGGARTIALVRVEEGQPDLASVAPIDVVDEGQMKIAAPVRQDQIAYLERSIARVTIWSVSTQ